MAESQPSQRSIESALIGLCIGAFSNPNIHENANLLESGGNSKAVDQLTKNIGQIFQVSLSREDLEHYPTPRLLAQRVIAARSEKKQDRSIIRRVPRDKPLPLSFSQERMWFVHQMEPDSTAYNVGGAFGLIGPLNREAFEKGINLVIRRHEMLRTVFPVVDGHPVQTVLPAQPIPIDWVDLSALPEAERTEAARQSAEACTRMTFQLENKPPFFLRLIRLNPENHVVALNMHHILVDAWGVNVFIRDLVEFYNALVKGEEVVVAEPDLQYVDYAVWQRELLSGAYLEKQKTYWRERLKDVLSVELPTDYPRPAVQTYRGATLLAPIPDPLHEALLSFCQEENATLFMFYLAAFYLLLYRYTDQADLTVAVPIANRNFSVTANMLGTLVNTLLMRSQVAANTTFRKLLAQVRKTALEAFDHQDLPYAQLIAELQPDRDASRSPVTQVMFNVVNVPSEAPAFEGLALYEFETDRLGVQFDLTVTITEMITRPVIRVEYNTDLFNPSSVEQLLTDYQQLIERALANPDLSLHQLYLVEPPIVRAIQAWDAKQGPYAPDETLARLFEEQARQASSKPACFSEKTSLTYDTLNQHANQIARFLQQQGVQSGDAIGLYAPRSPDAMAALLGIWKAGGTALPMPVDAAPEQLIARVQNAAPRVILAQAVDLQPLTGCGVIIIDLDAARQEIREQDSTNLDVRVLPDNPLALFYIMEPDGQQRAFSLTHRALFSFFASLWRVFPAQADEVFCLNARLDSPAALWEMFGPLLHQIPTVVLPDEAAGSLPRLAFAIQQHSVTRWWLRAEQLAEVLQSPDAVRAMLGSVRLWLYSGTPVSAEQEAAFAVAFPHARLVYLGELFDHPEALPQFGKQFEYWQQKLRGIQPILEIPADHPRPAALGNHRARVQKILLAALVQNVRRFLPQDSTLVSPLSAAFDILLYRYTNQEEIILATPAPSRTPAYILPMRVHPTPDCSFWDMLAQVQKVHQDAYANSSLPLDLIIEAAGVPQVASHTPICQAFFALYPAEPRVKWSSNGHGATPLLPANQRYDLRLEAWEAPDGLHVILDYNADLFDPATIQRMAGHYQALLEGICADPTLPISRLPLLTEPERRVTLEDWNHTQAAYPSQPLPALISQQTARTPQAVAVQDETRALTYGELERLTNQLARQLKTLGVEPETLVGVCLPRSLQMLIALLAVHKAGGAYIPLDPHFPSDRLAYMLEDSAAPLLITTSDLLERFPNFTGRALCLDREEQAIRQQPDGPLPLTTTLDHLAYVLYTSGSTGRPKGVQVLQRGLVNFLTAMQAAPGLLPEDVLLSVTTFSFDISGLEFYLPLITGARLVLVSSETAADGQRLRQALESCGATFLQATPATYRLLLAAGWEGGPHLTLLCGGEAFPPELAAQLVTRCRTLLNMYGPTETTIWSSMDPITSADQRITIGRPIANTQLYVLDARQQPLPAGVPGELYIGGDGLARGYLHRPELTAQKFVPSPFTPGARLYRTGDLVRYLPDGRVEFLGRMDHQVKLRGYRIELGEIEEVLLQHPAIRQAVVIIREDKAGDARLVAYLVPGDGSPSDADLRGYLQQKLPAYMIPAAFVSLPAFPLTPNGKVDRKALPEPQASEGTRGGIVQAHDATEAKLVQIWKNLLHVKNIGVNDDFFELGGHSMMAVQMLMQIQDVFGINIPLASLFRYATIEHLARIIKEELGSSAWSSLVELQPQGNKPPFFCVHGLTGNVFWFSRLVPHLDPDQPLWGLQSQGLDGAKPALASVEEMAALYIKEMRSIQPEGPYYICGYSFGGTVAYEMARQLEQAGCPVGLLAVIDHANPKSGYYQPKISPRLLLNAVEVLPERIGDILRLRPDQFIARLRRKFQVFLKNIRHRQASEKPTGLAASDLIDNADEMPQPVQEVIVRNYQAIQAYTPGRYSGRLTLLRARGSALFVSHDPHMGWTKYASQVDVRLIHGSHLALFEPSRIQHLAKALQECLQESQTAAENQTEAQGDDER